MQSFICWKCRRSVEPLERIERDKASRKSWNILYCPYERCNANLDLHELPKIKLWNGSNFFDPDDEER